MTADLRRHLHILLARMPVLSEHSIFLGSSWDQYADLSVGLGALDDGDAQPGDFPFVEFCLYNFIKLEIEQ